jgi:hypothetical protein
VHLVVHLVRTLRPVATPRKITGHWLPWHYLPQRATWPRAPLPAFFEKVERRVPHPNVALFDVRVGFHGRVELGILQRDRLNLRVSPAFDEPSNGRESEMPAPSGFDHVSTTKSNSTRSITAHPFDGLREARKIRFGSAIGADRLSL